MIGDLFDPQDIRQEWLCDYFANANVGFVLDNNNLVLEMIITTSTTKEQAEMEFQELFAIAEQDISIWGFKADMAHSEYQEFHGQRIISADVIITDQEDPTANPVEYIKDAFKKNP